MRWRFLRFFIVSRSHSVFSVARKNEKCPSTPGVTNQKRLSFYIACIRFFQLAATGLVFSTLSSYMHPTWTLGRSGKYSFSFRTEVISAFMTWCDGGHIERYW